MKGANNAIISNGCYGFKKIIIVMTIFLLKIMQPLHYWYQAVAWYYYFLMQMLHYFSKVT